MKNHYKAKKPLVKAFIFRAGVRDVELLRAAADQAEISQSEFVRLALREKAARVLSGFGENEPGRSNLEQAV